ncbi:MAG: cytochrome c oxidase assembly protein [Hyphomicrobiaceae bacterium]|nr:cytochrome c oxidase assembly protein [Hyphomicrobiaceae bacterium]
MPTTYCGPSPLPEDVLTRWNLDPIVIAGLALLGLLLARRPGGAMATGVLALAFVSPLCALTSALFSARVVHHLLLAIVAAPLIATALERRLLRTPMLALTAFTGVLWLWHLPAAYEAALADTTVYWAMQATLLGSAVWFWSEALSPDGYALSRLPLVVAGFAQMGLLGALLTFAPVPLYPSHAIAPLSWGLQPLVDQQLGGLIMWVPAGIPFAVAAAALLRRTWRETGLGAS